MSSQQGRRGRQQRYIILRLERSRLETDITNPCLLRLPRKVVLSGKESFGSNGTGGVCVGGRLTVTRDTRRCAEASLKEGSTLASYHRGLNCMHPVVLRGSARVAQIRAWHDALKC
eukprot:scaffold39330_cov61-Cyclotella_meneghiniana.AAC.5